MKNKWITSCYLLVALLLAQTAFAQQAGSGANRQIPSLATNEKIALLSNESARYPLRFADVSNGLAMLPNASGHAEVKPVKATAFPVPFVLACSWNKSLAQQVGAATGKEAAAHSEVDAVLAPALNIIRNPLTGNNWAYFSEDPVLVYQMASAMLRGIQSQGVPFVLRYYGLYNHEKQKEESNILIDQRTLYEIYLRPFERICRSMPVWGILTAYIQINGHFMAENRQMLEGVLRGIWNYNGMIFSEDYPEMDFTGLLRAGTTLALHVSKAQQDSVRKALAAGTLSEEELDHHLQTFFNAYGQLKKRPAVKYVATEHHRLAKEAATESMVLVKNIDESLPIAEPIKRVAFFGVSSYRLIQSPQMQISCGVYGVDALQHSSPVQQFMEGGFTLDPALINVYLKYMKGFLPEEKTPAGQPSASAAKPATAAAKQGVAGAKPATTSAQAATAKTGATTGVKTTTTGTTAKTGAKPLTGEELMKTDLKKMAALSAQIDIREMEVSKSMAQQYAKTSQMGIVVIGHANRPGLDRTLENGYLLSETEQNMIKNVCAAYHAWGKKVVVILNVDGPVDFTEWMDYPDAILYCGIAGEGAAEALKDLLTGKSCPSGKLNMSYAKTYAEYPSAPYFQPVRGSVENQDENLLEINYAERFNIGYRYFDLHQEMVLFPFGYGLSYTTFSYDKMTLLRKGDSLIVSVRITNTGKYAGKEVVQLYVSPQRKHLIMEKPLKELKDFAKTRLLKPGESQLVTLRFSEFDLAAFDDKSDRWITSAGSYTLKVGASSQDIKLQYPLQLTEDIVY